MSLGIENAYIGQFSGFKFVPESDVNPNTVVTEGRLTGVTRQKTEAGATGYARLGTMAEVWNFSLSATAIAPVSRGVEAYIDTDGKVSFSAGGDKTTLGVLWSPVKTGDTCADIMLYPATPTDNSGLTTAQVNALIDAKITAVCAADGAVDTAIDTAITTHAALIAGSSEGNVHPGPTN